MHMKSGNAQPSGFERAGAFSVTFILLFVLSVSFLAAVDALPEKGSVANEGGSSSVEESGPQAPVRVVAKAIGMDVTIENPRSTSITVLDDALLRGAVRYPTSAMLGEEGTVLLFGHSSYLPVVYNQAYKAFNKIQNLENGDVVSVFSEGAEYRYRVTGVRVADATEDVVELRSNGTYLTLVTCDSFSSKTSRFVVTAEFVGAHSLTD